jgi:hypothetical protein
MTIFIFRSFDIPYDGVPLLIAQRRRVGGIDDIETTCRIADAVGMQSAQSAGLLRYDVHCDLLPQGIGPFLKNAVA